MKVWIDGAIVDGAQARVPVTDHGFLYGDGVFDAMRAYGRRVFRLDDHMDRLETALKAVHLQVDGGMSRLREIVQATVSAHENADSYVRIIVTRGEGSLGVDPSTCHAPRVICIVDDIKVFPPEALQAGIDLVTVSLRRPPADVLDPRIKSLNYLNNVLAKHEARARGADEALILNHAGLVAEASVANVFAFLGDELLTPPPSDGALAGITRRAVMELAASQGTRVAERSLGRFDLFGAAEVFLTGTGARIVPVRSLDGEVIGTGRCGPRTERLIAALDALVRA
jgi:branched-chain amino acid aminotransferase